MLLVTIMRAVVMCVRSVCSCDGCSGLLLAWTGSVVHALLLRAFVCWCIVVCYVCVLACLGYIWPNQATRPLLVAWRTLVLLGRWAGTKGTLHVLALATRSVKCVIRCAMKHHMHFWVPSDRQAYKTEGTKPN